MTKKKYLPRKVKDIKGAVAISELRRAHAIIVLLSLALAFLVVASSQYPLQLDGTLGALAVVLLVIVCGSSAATVLALKYNK